MFEFGQSNSSAHRNKSTPMNRQTHETTSDPNIRSGALTPGAIMQLQAKIGNQALIQLLKATSPTNRTLQPKRDVPVTSPGNENPIQLYKLAKSAMVGADKFSVNILFGKNDEIHTQGMTQASYELLIDVLTQAKLTAILAEVKKDPPEAKAAAAPPQKEMPKNVVAPAAAAAYSGPPIAHVKKAWTLTTAQANANSAKLVVKAVKLQKDETDKAGTRYRQWEVNMATDLYSGTICVHMHGENKSLNRPHIKLGHFDKENAEFDVNTALGKALGIS